MRQVTCLYSTSDRIGSSRLVPHPLYVELSSRPNINIRNPKTVRVLIEKHELHPSRIEPRLPENASYRTVHCLSLHICGTKLSWAFCLALPRSNSVFLRPPFLPSRPDSAPPFVAGIRSRGSSVSGTDRGREEIDASMYDSRGHEKAGAEAGGGCADRREGGTKWQEK